MSLIGDCNTGNIHKTFTFNVGGENFTFSRQSLEASGENMLSCSINSRWCKEGERFIDADPKIFRKYIAPYIRDLVVPNVNYKRKGSKINRIISVAKRLGITPIVDHVESSQIKTPKEPESKPNQGPKPPQNVRRCAVKKLRDNLTGYSGY